MNAFYLIDKPIWISSFDIIRKLRKKLSIKKMWHTWTLDPLATGLVLVAVWNYTKLIPYLEKDTKEYEFEIWLDWISESFDLWTEVNYISEKDKEKFKKSITQKNIENILKNNFSWKIRQLPPKYSALKIWWKKAYELARAWENFELKDREVTIHNIKIISFSYPDLVLKAKVSAWTYIRSIAFDLWNLLWCWWYIKTLRRTKIWELGLDLSQELDNFEREKILEEKDIFNKNQFISLSKDILEKINNGLKVKWDFDFPENIDLFLFKDNLITNVVKYDWSYLMPIKKLLS